MHTDSFYTIGKTHATCQDFAVAGNNGQVAYAIVSDGCSSSKHVEFGARVVAYMARKVALTSILDSMFTLSAGDIANLIRAEMGIVKHFELPLSSLDATLLLAIVNKGQGRVLAWGDGVFMVGNQEGSVTTHIDYVSEGPRPVSAPYYLSYGLSASRNSDYLTNLGQVRTETVISSGGGSAKRQSPPTEITDYHFTAKPGTRIVLMSDGINTFRTSSDDAVPWEPVFNELCTFPVATGEFARRSLKAMQRDLRINGGVHKDDVSMAAIIV